MSKTLLKVVQEVLASISGDEVDSITDTVEASDVASVVEACFEEIVTADSDRENSNLFTLTAIGVSKPTMLERPEEVLKINWFRYDVREDGDPYPCWRDLQFLSIEDFTLMTLNLPSESDTTIESFSHTVNGSTLTFYIRNDRAPTYFTTLDDTTILCDAYDSEVDTSLQESKTLCFGEIAVEFEKTDGFVIPFDTKTTLKLVEKAKARASVEIRQTQNPAAEKVARRLHVRSQFDNKQIGPRSVSDNRPDYGRK